MRTLLQRRAITNCVVLSVCIIRTQMLRARVNTYTRHRGRRALVHRAECKVRHNREIVRGLPVKSALASTWFCIYPFFAMLQNSRETRGRERISVCRQFIIFARKNPYGAYERCIQERRCRYVKHLADVYFCTIPLSWHLEISFSISSFWKRELFSVDNFI